MARLEDLIKHIADPRLWNQIADEVGKLKARGRVASWRGHCPRPLPS
jgi:hypothetical protein